MVEYTSRPSHRAPGPFIGLPQTGQQQGSDLFGIGSMSVQLNARELYQPLKAASITTTPKSDLIEALDQIKPVHGQGGQRNLEEMTLASAVKTIAAIANARLSRSGV